MCREAACSHSVVLNRKSDAVTSGVIRRFFVKNINFFENKCLIICIIQKFVLYLQYKIQGHMKRLTNKEKDLIEAIRNFKRARGWIEREQEFRWLIYKLVEELIEDD